MKALPDPAHANRPHANVAENREKWWDNLENKPWDSMGRSAMVGHDKLLTRLACVAPLLGTKHTLAH